MLTRLKTCLVVRDIKSGSDARPGSIFSLSYPFSENSPWRDVAGKRAPLAEWKIANSGREEAASAWGKWIAGRPTLWWATECRLPCVCEWVAPPSPSRSPLRLRPSDRPMRDYVNRARAPGEMDTRPRIDIDTHINKHKHRNMHLASASPPRVHIDRKCYLMLANFFLQIDKKFGINIFSINTHEWWNYFNFLGLSRV